MRNLRPRHAWSDKSVRRALQYIRINGTLVGGLVGLIIFAVTQLF
ncbi:DUF445 family protein [Bradyrhizobium sp.]